MRATVRNIAGAFLLVTIALAGAVLLYPDSGTAAPVMTTDKADYFAAETVTVTGTGFAPNTQYDIPIIRPDGSLVKGDGTLTPGWDTVTSDGSGGFTYLYKLDGIFGTYEVRAYPVSWSGNLADGPLTSVTFTDADIHFSQCSNDTNNDDVPDPCSWVSGGLNGNNSIFAEGQAVPHRLFHKLTTVGAYQFEFHYDFSKGDVYAYDFLTSPDQGPQNSEALLNPCADVPSFAAACTPSNGNALYDGATSVAIASDPFDAVPGAEAAIATRQMKVACSGPGTCSAIAVFFPSCNGADDPGECHDPDVDPNDCNNATATKCGTMSVKIRVSVTTPAGTSNTTPTLVAIWFGAHLSLEGYWGTTCGTGSTDPCGASSISGAPFHLQYACLDEPDSPDRGCLSVGNRDNQISPGSVTSGDIVITKNVITQSGEHPQDFNFTCSPTLGSFSLDDDSGSATPTNTQTFQDIPATTYTCTESAPPTGWSLTNLVCSDPDGGTTVNVGTRTATIDLDNGETVTCTYTNTATGTIDIIKDAVPDDAQDFNFSCTSPLGSFTLDDDADPTLSNTRTFSGVLAGTYQCTESIPIMPWSLASISCSDPDLGTTTGGFTATIDLDPGETITCTFTNDKGSVTIVKDAVPNHAQDFTFSGSCFGSFSLDDDADPALSNTIGGNVGVGICTVTESAPPSGWTLTSIVCSDPDNGTTVNLGTRTATIDVDAAENITCTFTNTGQGTIVIQKICDPPADPQLFTFARSYGADVNLACGGTNSTNLSPGTHSVSETVPLGWDLTGATCSDGSAPGSISLQVGETVTCTFTNQKDAFIIVCKETNPDGDPQSFSFAPSYGPSFSLTDGTCNNSGDLAPGTYSVSETAPPGWVLSGSSCSDGSSVASIGLSAGETVTCTFNNTKTGSITIVKDAIPNGTQGFFFTCSSPIGSFTLDDDGTNGNPFDSSKTTSGLLPGTYSCSEALPSGWVLTSATCSDGSIPSSIVLSAGENVTCTFVNTKLGSITIVKDAVPDDPQDFSFTCSDPIGPFTLDDDGANGNPLDNSKTQGGLLPGSFSCSEAVPAGWALSSISCAGDVDGGSVVALPGVTIDLDAGEDIACTFTNTQGSITIVKDTVPNGPQDFCFNGDLPDANGAGTGDFCLDDDADGTLSNSHSVGVAPGTYSVNELGPTAGFDLTAITCADPDNGTTVNLGTATATIDLDAGESITCTFTNTQRGHILVDKVTNPAGSSQSFEFDPSYGANFFLTDAAAANNSGALVPGTYSVQEVNIPADWSLTSATCSDGSNTANIGLDAGETVTCTFTNTQQGHINICKVTDPAGSSQSFDFDPSYGADFSLIDGQCNDSGPLVPGSYSTSEINLPTDWILTSLVCADPDNGSSPSVPAATANIDLDPGETVTCTFTNTQKGHILVDKVTNPAGSSQSFEFDPSYGANFFLTDAAAANDSGALAPGTYSVAEVNIPADWSLASATCSDGSNPASIGLAAGETVTCTFTNTQKGHILVDKVTDPPGSPQSFEFDPSYGINFFLTDTSAANNSGALTPGTYSVAEINIPAGWSLTGSTCSDGSNPANIGLDAGETVTCTFTNGQQGTITIVKDVANPPGTDPQDFSFTCSAPIGSFSLDDDADGTLSNTKGPVTVAPGTYSCSEAPVSGWQTISSCSDGSPVSAIAVGGGESVICTFTNTPVGNVTINKTCEGADATFGYTGTLGSFNLTCVNGSASQSFNNVPVGTKTVTESTLPSGWSFAGLTCSDPDNGTTASGPTATIDLDAGETVTCTYTNVKSATVVIVKNTVPDAAQDFDFACAGLGTFTLDDDADGTLPNTKQFDDVAPGNYTCTETNVMGYQITISCADPDGGSSGSAPDATIDADPGETVTCTFTNTFRSGNPPVGGVLGLIDAGGSSQPRADAPKAGDGYMPAAIALVLGGLGAGAVLAAAGVWLARRRSLG